MSCSKKLYIYIYTSIYTGQNISTDLEDIIHQAKKNNPIHNVSGVLFFHNNRFLQIIEGDKKNLDQLKLNITKDSRHKEIQQLFYEPILSKSFSNWNMDTFNLSDKENVNIKELNLVSEVYKTNFLPRGDQLADFYKETLGSNFLT
jgi:hypothetical protein